MLSLSLSLAFLTSLLITLLVIRYQHLHGHLTADHDLDGVQKFHATPVPRVGGVGVFLGLLGGLLAKWWVDDPVATPNLILLACALPAFGAGLVEDLTKRVGVRERLMATALSALPPCVRIVVASNFCLVGKLEATTILTQGADELGFGYWWCRGDWFRIHSPNA